MGLRNDVYFSATSRDGGSAKSAAKAVARGSAGFVNTYRPEQWLTGLTEPPGAVGQQQK